MSVSIHGTGTIIGIDQGIQISGVSTFSNNVSIGGTLTYEDVTNIDSIGIITARSGIIGDLTGNVTGNLTGNIAGTSTIAGISSSISDTANDIFIYDTSKDSDGGAWRKRTQHTSWYNETLNTATRGSRKEFPAVAVIVTEDTKVTIYDGDDPDLPMWMVFLSGPDSSNERLLRYAVNKASAMLNAVLCVATRDTLVHISFIDEYHNLYHTQDEYYFPTRTGIVDRNVIIGEPEGPLGNHGIVSSTTNDVAMTVLPNAPIDAATGLHVPTIAVATDDGVSIIRDDGSIFDVIDSNSARKCYDVSFTKDHKLMYTGDLGAGSTHAGNVFVTNILTANRAEYDNHSDLYRWYSTSTNYPRINGGDTFNTRVLDPVDVGGNHYAMADVGVSLIEDGTSSSVSNTDGMVAYITSDYNSGYQHGDIKGAFLSDTDTTNLVEGDVLGGKGTFDDASYWTVGASWTVSGGVATSDSSGISYLTKNGILTTGARYVIKVTVSSYSTGTLYVYCGTGAPGLQNHYFGISGNGTYIMVLDAYNTNFGLYGANFGGVVDNVTVSSVVDQDRSVNGKDLGVIGTVTRSAVATGAELVAYSGFQHTNPDNYLKQPYNSDLDFGTGDFSVTWWQYITGDIANSEYVYDRQGGNGNRHAVYYTTANSGSLAFYTVSGSASEALATGINSYKDGWACYTVSRSSTGLMQIYINGELKQSNTLTVRNLTNTSAELFVGIRHSLNTDAATQAKFALMRFSKSIPSPEQVKKMYEDEKHLFQENAKATLYGSSDAVTALAYDEVTDQLHVGTSAGRSDFQGLRRINNTTTAVTTAISASDELIAEQ